MPVDVKKLKKGDRVLVWSTVVQDYATRHGKTIPVFYPATCTNFTVRSSDIERVEPRPIQPGDKFTTNEGGLFILEAFDDYWVCIRIIQPGARHSLEQIDSLAFYSRRTFFGDLVAEQLSEHEYRGLLGEGS